MKRFFKYSTAIALLLLSCGEKKHDHSSKNPPNHGPSLTDNTPETFTEITPESLTKGANLAVTDANALPMGWRFSVPQKGTLEISNSVVSTSCDGESKISFALHAFDSNGALNENVLSDLNSNSEHSIVPGAYALVIGKSSKVKCSRIDVSFTIKLVLPNVSSGEPDKIEFKGFHYIQELNMAPAVLDSGALFIIHASAGKIVPESVTGPSFLKEVSIDTITKENLTKLFSYSLVPPSEAWKSDILEKYNGGTFLYFRKYPTGLCDGQEHAVTLKFHEETGSSHAATWSFIAYQQNQAPCKFASQGFLVFTPG